MENIIKLHIDGLNHLSKIGQQITKEYLGSVSDAVHNTADVVKSKSEKMVDVARGVLRVAITEKRIVAEPRIKPLKPKVIGFRFEVVYQQPEPVTVKSTFNNIL